MDLSLDIKADKRENIQNNGVDLFNYLFIPENITLSKNKLNKQKVQNLYLMLSLIRKDVNIVVVNISSKQG